MGATARTWVRQHPGVLLLVAAVLVGQVVANLAQPHLSNSPMLGRVPVFPAATLGIAIVLALVVVWLRVRLGQQLVETARTRAFSLPKPASLPRRYDVVDAPQQVTSAGLGVLDVALLLLIQGTFRGAILALADELLILRGRADAAFVTAVVVIAVALLIKLWRTGGPVLVLLLWWGIDRLVPTAGFVAVQPELVPARTTSVSKPALPAVVNAGATLGATIVEADATVAAPVGPAEEATLLAEATVVSHRTGPDADG